LPIEDVTIIGKNLDSHCEEDLGRRLGQPLLCRKCYFVLADELEGFLESGNLEIAGTEWIACCGFIREAIRAMMM
jgi:hypothetical protein